MSTFLNAFTMVFFAEMGDKSQILAMSFAAKYPIRKVAMGIFIGIAVNHGLAVALGFLLGKMLPISFISTIAGLLFLYFGLASFQIDKEEEDDSSKMGMSIVSTIALAFFLGEFGDKTQLTATALASGSPWPFIVFAGTFSAMLATSALGIALGSLLGSKIPQHLIKGVSGMVFLVFGTQKLFEQLPVLMTPWIMAGYLTLLTVIALFAVKPLYLDWRSGRLSPMQKAAQHLKHMQEELKHLADGLCIGPSGPVGCGICKESGCIVGQTKLLIKDMQGLSPPSQVTLDVAALDYAVDKQFNVEMAAAGLKLLKAFEGENALAHENFKQQLKPIEERLQRIAKQQ